MTEQQPPRKGMSKGCRIALIIFGILLLLVIAVIVLSYVFCSQIQDFVIEKAVNSAEEAVLRDLPAGFDEQEVKSTFREFKEALKSGALQDEENAERLQKLVHEVQYALSDEEIDKEELERILGLMKQIVGRK
jgi:hypothetical protein